MSPVTISRSHRLETPTRVTKFRSRTSVEVVSVKCRIRSVKVSQMTEWQQDQKSRKSSSVSGGSKTSVVIVE